MRKATGYGALRQLEPVQDRNWSLSGTLLRRAVPGVVSRIIWLASFGWLQGWQTFWRIPEKWLLVWLAARSA